MYQISFYVPSTHLEEVKEALFRKGAGRYGAYDCCCWQCKGVGQFRPLAGSNPFIGEAGRIESVDEYKVEMVCSNEYIKDVLLEFIRVHPYEEPAYALVKLDMLSDFR